MDIKEVKANLNKLVRYESKDKSVSGEYLFTGCIIRRYGKEFGYTAELQQNQRSLLIVRLEEIEAITR
jgi:hypothetical protein